MQISARILREGSSSLSVAEALQLVFEFGGFVISLLTFVLALIMLQDKKK